MSDVESWLDDLEPIPGDARDAGHLRAIYAANSSNSDAQEQLVRTIAAARLDGESWTVIGAALGVTRQAAEQRFGSRVRTMIAAIEKSA